MNSALEIAAAVRGGQSALVAVEESLTAIRARNEELNVFLYVDEDGARAAAARVDEQVRRGEDPGLLAGVPIALKDNLCTTGIPTTCSSKILEGWKPPYNATVVDRLVAQGAISMGKTNLDEFAMGSSTENSAFGPTRNPLDPARVPGGSSGGSAAAVASNMTPISLGSDTGGSIRQPAALCGLVGVKPTYGLVSRYGLIAFASSLDQIGPFAHSVSDAALLLEAIAGHDPLDSTSLPEPTPSLLAHVADGVAGKRIGLVRELVDGADEDVVRAVNKAVETLKDAGATIVELSIPELHLGLSAYYLIAPAEASSNLARFDGVRFGNRVDGEDVTAMMEATRTAGFGAEVKRRIMLGTYALSAGYFDAYYGQALKVRTRMIEAFATAYQQVDMIIGATTPSVAFEFGSKTNDPMAMYLNDVFTIPTNLAGEAAISVPFGTGEANLPIGVQLLGPGRSEARLFAAARVLEIADGRA
ncbi:MAG: Asp-tRNA(Asn)/Glu-tRNA(Gln) amidotransferase subunit GatA [Actinobacteria bacterium]|uniref:glutaminyl-tRNA synthase (glutamine-hydrolyzing) n=1 Tax=freshwater metagenome TaxID=449393 RepID=A0A6J6X398_9ZZZZ|nr:Asp-tRNA(Asn)/Glu-tRNA(Gln) amidotransferase subunit GatA [Actinomycetota bacterium]